MDKIVLTGLEFFGYHGALPEENVIGQRFIVDVAMYLDLSEAGIHDDLRASINYAEVYEKVQDIVEGEPFKTIEAVAEEIAAMLHSSYARLKKAEITVHKPGAPIAGIFHDVAVTIQR